MKTIVIILAVLAGCSAVIQEITLHESLDGKTGNTYIFRGPVPDTSVFNFSKVVRYCHNTRMMFYRSTNFQSGTFGGYHGDSNCHNGNISNYKSFQFFGNVDTTVDQISLYSDIYFGGEELKISRSPYGGITTPIKSLAATGASGWTLFEGTNFEGRTQCLYPGTSDSNGHPDFNNLNLATVGSLVKGCVTKLSVEGRAALRKLATYN